MKKSSLILILVGCFVVGITAKVFITNYERQKVKQQFLTNLEETLPSLTPTEVFKNYWIFASQNRLDEVKLLTTKTPISYWVRCREEKPDESLLVLDEDKKTAELSDLTYGVGNHFGMMRANRPRLSELKILKETIFEDEATVDFEYLNFKNRAFFKKVDGAWKLFDFNSLSFDYTRVDEYAHPRPDCKKPETNFNGQFKAIELPEIKSKSELP